MKGINTYRKQALTTADPYAIVVALYDGLLRHLLAAQNATLEGQRGVAGERFGKALAILSELEASVDLSQNEEFGHQLSALYGWFSQEILQANLRNDVERVSPIITMITELREAWDVAARTLRASKVA